MADVIQKIEQLAGVPSDEKTFQHWIQMNDAIAFLKESISDDEFLLYACAQFIFLHAVVVPRADFAKNKKALLAWDFKASSTWTISSPSEASQAVNIYQPLEDARNGCYRSADQLVFWRNFEGRIGEKSYFEILQKFLHISDLHLDPERNAYCRLDSHGDVEETIRVITISKSAKLPEINLVTCKGDVLARYAALTDSAVVRMFDFTRFRPENFSGWSESGDSKDVDDGNLMYHLHLETNNSSYMRGVQIVEPSISKADAARYIIYGDTAPKRYSSFIALDWRHNRVAEISCEPGKTANYFIKSDLPFELSPAFFRPEVLAKYKADSEKYRVDERSITCRGTWQLDSIDVNNQGQVHAYICDLRDLPYEEQLHWKAYNEEPKGAISKRALTNDFEGSWSLEYNPLQSVKQRLRLWNKIAVPWWTLRDEKLLNVTNYPVTASTDEWSDELLRLDQLIVEGFIEGWIKKQAGALGRTPDAACRSLKLIDECFFGLKYATDQAEEITAPLKELHSFRSKLKGHASGTEAKKIRQATVKKHKTYKAHFRDLCGRIDRALNAIEEAFQKIKPLTGK